MIYLLVAVLVLCVWRFAIRARREGWVRVLKSILAAAAFGLVAGVFIGVGARLGMSAIVVANGGSPNFTLPGSFSVVTTFAGFGLPLGLVYEGLFRQLFRRHGLAYGALLTLCSWYPLAHAAAQQLSGHPSTISLVFVSGAFVALMWLPFGFALELLLAKWHGRHAHPVLALVA